MKTVESKYNTMIDTQEQNTDFLKDENVLVSKMTAKEADIVNKDQKVVSVEKNTMVNASETESTTAAKDERKEERERERESVYRTPPRHGEGKAREDPKREAEDSRS